MAELLTTNIKGGLTVSENTNLTNLTASGTLTADGLFTANNNAIIRGNGNILQVTKNDSSSTPVLTVNSNGTITTSSGLTISVGTSNTVDIKKGDEPILTINNDGEITFKKNITISDTDGISFKGSMSTDRAIKFIDNTANEGGNGVIVGAGGALMLGSGESADNLKKALSVTGGTEYTYISSNNDISLYTGCSTIANRQRLTFNKSGNLVYVPAAGGTEYTYTLPKESDTLALLGNISNEKITLNDGINANDSSKNEIGSFTLNNGSAKTIYLGSKLVNLHSTQTIGGEKTFSNKIIIGATTGNNTTIQENIITCNVKETSKVKIDGVNSKITSTDIEATNIKFSNLIQVQGNKELFEYSNGVLTINYI